MLPILLILFMFGGWLLIRLTTKAARPPKDYGYVPEVSVLLPAGDKGPHARDTIASIFVMGVAHMADAARASLRAPWCQPLCSPRAALALACACLGGCAYAPGLSIGRPAETPAGAAADAPPPGALLSITPELIRHQRAGRLSEVSEDVRHLFGVAKPYQIGPGDVLNIVVWDHPELVMAPAGSSATTDAASLTPVGNGYNVSAAGSIQFPYVGDIRMSGHTESEARDLLTRRLSRYIKDPKITLRIQSYRSGRIYVDGEVRQPGLQAINDLPMTLPEAINRAGGFTGLADRSSIAVSRNGKTTVVDMQQLTELGINPSRILLGKGDMVRILGKDDAKVYILGEVTRPMAQPLRNGRLSLNEALGEAGGINNTTGDPRQVYVVRAAPDGAPEIFHLDASSATAYALAEGFALKPRDVVYVDPAPVVQWNRVISQILPSALVVNNASAATK
ncbi:capsular polysaccharide transporter [Comamonas phosphati]|nr:capsular polysaccharide transporter [Comamonas phosphati]